MTKVKTLLLTALLSYCGALGAGANATSAVAEPRSESGNQLPEPGTSPLTGRRRFRL